jgi:arginyl-tRNA synthetase
MKTSHLEGLENALSKLSVENGIPQYDGADTLHNPLDVGRSYLAELLCNLVDCEPNVAYRSIQCPNDITKGDFTVTLPKLRPGEKIDDWVPGLMEKVCVPLVERNMFEPG